MMRSTTARCLLLFVGGLLAAPVTPQRVKPQPIEPAELPADWGERDLEGRWVAFRAATGDADGDARTKKSWVLALAEHEDVALLEWIAMYEGWRHAGPQLARLDPEELMRAAAWNLGALDSHNQDNAEKAMRDRGGAAVGWFLEHPVAQRGKAAAMFLELKNKEDPDETAAARYLPPHDPMQVLVPWLDAPGELVAFGDRKKAEPRARYRHQVLRALDGVAVYGHADPTIVAKVLRLCRHRDQAVAAAAFRALSKLPGERVPHTGLVAIAQDPTAGLQAQRLAARTLSASAHPDAFFALHEIAGQQDHPARLSALAALGDVGDMTTVAMFSGFVVTGDEEILAAQRQAANRIRERRKNREFLQMTKLRVLLVRVAWLRHRGDARATAHADAAKKLLVAIDQNGALKNALDAAATLDATFAGLLFGSKEAAGVRREYESLVAELRK